MSGDLLPTDLVPTGGSWGGLLFANPTAGVPLALTWTFTFDFAQVSTEVGDISPSLTVDWVPLARGSWQGVTGANVTCSRFAEPVESSFYYFEHHRFDRVGLDVHEQDRNRIRASATVTGDVDRLGISDLTVESWLDFDGIYVQLPDRPATVQAATAALARFTNLDGLAGADNGQNFVFRPVDP